jgi:hypothetical protein
VEWINLAPNGDKWLAVVYMVMNLWVPGKAGYISLGEKRVAFLEGFCAV